MVLNDYGVSDDCINIDSYGEICVNCGCCSMNPNYRDRIIRQIRYYKRMLNEEYSFDNWIENESMRRHQEEVIKANILDFKREIRKCKKILRCLNPERYKNERRLGNG